MNGFCILCVSECPKGELCYDYSLYHYRDYAHSVLAKIRASKGHLQHGTLQCVTPKKEKITNHEGQHFSSTGCPLSSKKQVKKTSCDDVREHVSAHQNKLISGEQTHTLRRVGSFFVALKNGDKGTMKSGVHKCDLHESYAGNGHTGTVNCMTGDTDLKTCTSDKRNDEIRLRKINSTFSGKQGTLPNGKISKALKFSAENVKSAEFKGSKSNILPACEKNEGKFEEKTCAGGCNSECNHELKLRAIVKYTTDKLENNCGDNRIIRTRVLPCKMESDSECLNTVRATMSLVLSPSKENSRDGEDKIKTPVKVDASCSEAGWETIGIAALPGTEVHDVTLSLCKCTKTMQINCSLSHNHTVTNFTDKMDMKPRELESKFFSSVKELGLSHKSCENEAVEIPHHQMSVTSYFRSSRQSSSRTQNILTKNVKSTSSSFAVPQDSHCLKSCNLNTTLKERYEPSSKVPKQSKFFKHMSVYDFPFASSL
jgi:hypothetical protein